MRHRIFPFLAAVWLALPIGAAGNFYTWVDEAGVTHFVDSLDLVPVQYRVDAAKRTETSQLVGDNGEAGTYSVISSSTTTSQPADKPAPAPKGPAGVKPSQPPQWKGDARLPAAEEGTKLTTQDKEYWQALIEEWLDKKTKAESELKEVDRSTLTARTMTRPGFQEELLQLEERRKALLQDIAFADRMLRAGIPDQARRAGAPPGWLR